MYLYDSNGVNICLCFFPSIYRKCHYFPTQHTLPRLALVSLLNAKMGDFEALFGLVCSSYVTVSAGTHKRTPWNPLGDVNVDMVLCGNKLASVNLHPSLCRVCFFLCIIFRNHPQFLAFE